MIVRTFVKDIYWCFSFPITCLREVYLTGRWKTMNINGKILILVEEKQTREEKSIWGKIKTTEEFRWISDEDLIISTEIINDCKR